MDLKFKLRQLINRQSTSSLTFSDQLQSPSDFEPSVSSSSVNNVVEAQVSNDQGTQKDDNNEEEIIKTIEIVHYNDETFDAREYILLGLPEELDKNKISVDKKLLAKQLEVVSERVSRLILQKQTACVKELQTVYELQISLKETLDICKNSRRYLSCAMQQFTVASLGILSNYHKRQQLLGILRSLKMIKTLQQTDIRLKELLEEENYAGAINLCLECQKAVQTFRYYKCIRDFSSKLQDTIEMIEEQLDQALGKVCSQFDTNHYQKLHSAYRLLGKTQTAMDQLHMHFTTAIHNTTFSIVLGYVELCMAKADTSFHKRNYGDLCKYITPERFTAGLLDLCKVVWQIIHSYYRIMEWHNKHDTERVDEEINDSKIGLEANFNLRYVQQKLENGLIRIWHDVQQKLKIYLLACDLSSFKFEDFIQILDIINRLIEIGEEFCGSKSEDLQESLSKQSVNYFRNYHRAYVEELRMFLENEGWELCPVRNDFSIFQLAEFKFLKQSHTTVHSTPLSSPARSLNAKQTSEVGFFQKYYVSGNPFEVLSEDEDGQEALSVPVMASGDLKPEIGLGESDSSDSDVPDEIKQTYVDEKTGEVPNKKEKHMVNSKAAKGKAPILTNTTLNVLRLLGKYMQMMNVLKPIAFDVVICMSQLFDYYMYAIYSFFVTDKDTGEFVVGEKLQTTLRRIKENLIFDESFENTVGTNKFKDKVPKPNLSPVVNLNSESNLFGFGERLVAAESLVFLADQLKLMQNHLEILIPETKRKFLQQFYSYTVCMASEVRSPVYMAVAIRAIKYDHVLEMMTSVKWDVSDLMSQHSPYVDNLVREMQLLSMRLSEVNRLVPIPKEASDVLWTQCIRLTNRTFVEGFAGAKKCSNEGRALMQLDYQQFLMKLEKITNLSPIPDKEYVENYIKAFYLPETILENWIITHKEYLGRHLIALVNCISHINKKGKQKLIGIIEDSDRNRK